MADARAIPPDDGDQSLDQDAINDGDRVLDDTARNEVDAYTKRVRKHTTTIRKKDKLATRLNAQFEAANRKMWYALFRRWFKNPTTYERIPIRSLRSVFIIPKGEAIGDLIAALPLCRAIKRRNPDCKVGVLVTNRNKALLRCDDCVDEQYHFGGRLDITHYREIARARKARYQVVVSMRFERMTEFGLLANIINPDAIKLTISHARKELYQILFNLLGPFERHSMHLSQLGLLLLARAIIFDEPLRQWESRPTLIVCEETRTKVNVQIDRLLAENGAKWYIYCNTQARAAIMEWGTPNTAEFSRRFSERYPEAMIFFTASPVRQDEVKHEIDAEVFKSSKFFETSYDLLELAALAERARIVITPDTSVIHFGVAAERPTLTLWADKEHLPMEWIPLNVPSRHLAPDVVGDPVSTISVDEVWQAACELIDGTWLDSQTSLDRSAPLLPHYQRSNKDRDLETLMLDVLEVSPEGLHALPTAARLQ